MGRVIIAIVFLFSTLISPPLAARPKRRAQKPPPPEKISIYAVWADSGEVLAAQNENLKMVPASTVKLITTTCALKKLGPGHRFETRYYSEAPPEAGVLQNLWIKGFGDPSFVEENLPLVSQQIQKMGVKKITGNIYIDASYFENGEYPGRQVNDLRPYNAPTSAVALNFNTAAVKKRRRTFYRTVANPAIFFGEALAKQLKLDGIALEGIVAEKNVEDRQLLFTYFSPPLQDIVARINQFSNNFMAEQVTKYLGARIFGAPATTEKGVTVLKNCLAEMGVAADEIFLENGSGLSYRNRISAKNLVKVLRAGLRDSKIRQSLIDSLSVPGADGTMKARPSAKMLEGVLRAKTGSLFKISSLAGFVQAGNGRWIAFAILMNDLNVGLEMSHRYQDQMVYQWSQIQ